MEQGKARRAKGTATFVTTFRDYTHPACGNARFIPVRSDTDRILVANAVALQNVVDQTQALQALESEGAHVRHADLAFLSHMPPATSSVSVTTRLT
jgi:hypothetical protein